MSGPATNRIWGRPGCVDSCGSCPTHPELRPGVLDIDAHTPAEDVATELLSCPDEQDEVAYRQGTRHLAHLRNAPLDEHERRRVTVDHERDRVALHLARPADLDSFEFVAQSRRRPGPGEVEVRVEATSVNFINVLQAMGVYQHCALTRLPPAWRRLDAYIAGRTSVAGIMTAPLVRGVTALATRLPGPRSSASCEVDGTAAV
ncbi:hypothetical protein [Streptomyces sp. NPDC057794]|uniref:hypothetical protein n=1 Tax=Streptomyces sp. NPDC057794 TaxID=3346251 RepID=UPI00369D73F9